MTVHFKKLNSGNVTPLFQESILQAALEYHEKGLHVLPLDSDNVCHWHKEQQVAYEIPIPKDFAGKGVGVHLEKSGLVGIDVDCVQVVPFLETFLPPTATTCRKNKDTSWMFFKLLGEIGDNHSYKNYDDEGKLVEGLGSIKFKIVTALPPTIYVKLGEPLEWKEFKGLNALATITAKQLIETASRCFALAYIAKLWPEAGNRHEAGLAFAGALVHAGWNLENAQKAVRVLAKATNDNKVEDRLNELKTTYEAHKASKGVTGLSSLVELLSDSSNERAYLKQTLKAWLRGNPYPDKEPDKEKTESFDLSQYVKSAKDFLAMPIPHTEYIIHNWLPVGGLISVFAARGAGKTWFALQLAISVATGKDFFDWPITKPRRVLYIDGEMSLPMLQERIKQLCKGKIPENLYILPVALLRRDKRNLNIHQPETQQLINKFLDKLKEQGNQIELIILDNLSALGRGIDDNSNSDQENFLDWLLELRSLGYSVLTVGHEGKASDKGSRGASRKEDFLDTVIRLKAKHEDSNGANFEVSFTKIRGEKPNPCKLAVRLSSDEEGNLKWDTGNSQQEQPLYVQCLIAMHQHNPKTQKELAEEMKCVPSNLTDPIKIAFDKGLLTKKPLGLTPKGKALIQPLIKKLEELEDQM